MPRTHVMESALESLLEDSSTLENPRLLILLEKTQQTTSKKEQNHPGL